jgi:predicted transposase YbfD/YdcC
VAIDGKAQRGKLKFDSEAGCIHALSAYCHNSGIVLAQLPVASGAEPPNPQPSAKLSKIEQEGEAIMAGRQGELSVAPKLLAQIEWQGRVLTGDAIFCQRSLCKQVVEAGGDYLVQVKANQPDLQDEIHLLFEPPSADELARASWQGLPNIEIRPAKQVAYGHGRIEIREIEASSELEQYSTWPHLAQVCKLKRTWWERGVQHQALTYLITSLPKTVASASRLLELKRGHWAIENSLHHVKDMTFGEDHSLVHRGNGPDNMSLLFNTVVNLLHQGGQTKMAASLRRHSRNPLTALALMGISLV